MRKLDCGEREEEENEGGIKREGGREGRIGGRKYRSCEDKGNDGRKKKKEEWKEGNMATVNVRLRREGRKE